MKNEEVTRHSHKLVPTKWASVQRPAVFALWKTDPDQSMGAGHMRIPSYPVFGGVQQMCREVESTNPTRNKSFTAACCITKPRSVIDPIDVLQRADTSMKQKHLQLGYHLVAFLDVLGQREKFRELRLPKTADETAVVAEVLRQTAGFVTELREIFAKQFVIFESALTKVQGPVRPKFVGFSDSFVSSVPLRNPAGDLAAVVSLFSALSAAAVVMLTALSAKHPLRGGIDVGLATEIAPEEIYGTALERAYLLESREAGSPRILIGDELWNYLEVALANFKMQTTPEAKSIVAVITKIMELISIDSDGKRVLDYLGQVMVEHAGPGGVTAKKMVKPAYEFVLSEEKRVDLARNAKLVIGYKALRRYFESRLPLWNLKAENT